MLKSSENQDLSYVGMQLSEILFLLEHAERYGAEFVLEEIKHCAENAIGRFEQPQGVIVFEHREPQ